MVVVGVLEDVATATVSLAEQPDEHVALGEGGEEVAARVVREDPRDLRGMLSPTTELDHRRTRLVEVAADDEREQALHLGFERVGQAGQPRRRGDHPGRDRTARARADDRAPLVVLAQVEVAQRPLLEDGQRHAPRAAGPDPQVVEQRLGKREVDRHLAAHELLGEQVDRLDAAVDPARLVGQQLQAGQRHRGRCLLVVLIRPATVHATGGYDPGRRRGTRGPPAGTAAG